MSERMRRIRLWAASALTWIAAWIAPRPMRPIFRAYCMMLGSFPRELATGRTYGIVVVPWAIGFDDACKSHMLQKNAIEAAAAARVTIDSMIPPTDGTSAPISKGQAGPAAPPKGGE